MDNNTKLQQLRSRLLKVESELSTCRTSVLQDGSYAEAINEVTNERWGIHASGNGDFNNHRVRFELLS